MIKINNLSFTYNKSKKPILKDFSLHFTPGGVYGLLGKNGTGKSTLLHLMSGLLTPQSGKIDFKGSNIRLRQPQSLSDIFLVPEEFSLPALSLEKYIHLNVPFYPYYSREDLIRYLNCFEMSMDVNLQTLSMGQKKKVFMSFALATNTSLILMDEPTNGLDIPGKSQFRKFIASGMNEEKTMIISTHQVKDVDKILDHIVIIDNNQVLLNESVYNINQKIRCIESDNNALKEKALYTTPSLQGNSMLLPNEPGEEDGVLNLELLFNATLSAPEKIHQTLYHLF